LLTADALSTHFHPFVRVVVVAVAAPSNTLIISPNLSQKRRGMSISIEAKEEEVEIPM